MYEPSPAANAIGIGNTSFPIGLCHIIGAESSRATSQFYYTCEAASLRVKKSADRDKRPPCTAQVGKKRQSSKRSQICLPTATPSMKACTAIGIGNIFVTSFQIDYGHIIGIGQKTSGNRTSRIIHTSQTIHQTISYITDIT